jgi:hypothetical protein
MYRRLTFRYLRVNVYENLKGFRKRNASYTYPVVNHGIFEHNYLFDGLIPAFESICYFYPQYAPA